MTTTGRFPSRPVMIVTDDFMAAEVVAKFRQNHPNLIRYWEGKHGDFSGLEDRAVWATKTADEVKADIRRAMADLPSWDEVERQRQEDFNFYNRHLIPRLTQSGPPPVIPIPHRPPELAPDEVPRVVAKARAVAIFGPKRGRWK